MIKKALTKVLRERRRFKISDGVIARSMSMGMVVGFSPTVGLQMVLCMVISLGMNWMLGRHYFNIIIALIGSLVINPFTMVPSYAGYYLLGCTFMTCSQTLELESAAQITAIIKLGGEGALAIILGSIPFMVVGGPVGYWLGRQVEEVLKRRATRKRERIQEVARRRRELKAAETDAAPSEGNASARS